MNVWSRSKLYANKEAFVLFLSAILLLFSSNQSIDPVKRDLLAADAAPSQQQDSTHATVMGMANGHGIRTFQEFEV